MLKRFLKALGRSDPQPQQEGPTSGEALLDALREPLASRLRDSEQSPDHALADLLVAMAESDIPDDATAESRRLYGRSLLPLLLDNDARPPGLQLRDEDLDPARALLRSFFFREGDMQEKASTLLKFIEKRFAAEHFGQAEILLELFDSEPATRRHNELNLFYESMLVRTNGTRRSPPGPDTLRDWQQMAERGAPLPELLRFLHQQAGIRFHIRRRNPDETRAWNEALPDRIEHHARSTFLERVPPARWRPAPDSLDDIRTLLENACGPDDFQRQVEHLTRSAYFISRTVGRTGFEPLLVRYVSWIRETFTSPAIAVLPSLHLSALDENLLFGDIVRSIVAERLSSTTRPERKCSPDNIPGALTATRNAIADLAIDVLPEGDYDLAGLVLDHAIGYTRQADTRHVRLHRLL
ncbi:MAG: hypothetical protein EA398_07390 [Deltaproteobacteria bacterium]|nr:MAG: hypothetical protein EA398_07390 [Deltaproteobacteria bacterium]